MQVDNGPCTCSLNGTSGGAESGVRGCGDHVLDGEFFCYVVDPATCDLAMPSERFNGAGYRACSVSKLHTLLFLCTVLHTFVALCAL